MSKRLSRKEAHRLALHYAIVERDSFADANLGSDEVQAEKARNLASEFRRVLREEFDDMTWEDAFAARTDIVSVSIWDLMTPKKESA